ncbi:helix-turn-helix transcriptional regulator [Paraburkholderia fynbosensis]|uniref:Transcriptional regulator DauR n=1 Tax=Paraburkholderia fynbosensis TaxID=1200993 RepID=A0A6J5FUD0_9BURK|nr:PAS domain-containing protein [Paraburkholderia fynbosensis]CAB3787499.1 Transcriptional regulator DauR [Paraburkholderia fynbosensis]
MRKTKSTPARRQLLERYSRVADGIALLFFPYVEIVIHDLHSQTIAYIANNLSKRELGDDSALEEIDHVAQPGTIGPYEKINWDGRRMRCVSTVLLDDEGVASGVMCVNYNIAVFEEVKHVIDLVISGVGVVKQPEELFKDDWQERINTFLHGWLQERQLALNSLTRDHRRELVAALWEEGAFKGKSAANYVANVLGMGRATVYQHIRDLRDAAQ